jgi:hypothetical protein
MIMEAVSVSESRLCVRFRLVVATMLLTIVVAASTKPSAAESPTNEDQAAERTAASFYESRYRMAGFFLRAGKVGDLGCFGCISNTGVRGARAARNVGECSGGRTCDNASVLLTARRRR